MMVILNSTTVRSKLVRDLWDDEKREKVTYMLEKELTTLFPDATYTFVLNDIGADGYIHLMFAREEDLTMFLLWKNV